METITNLGDQWIWNILNKKGKDKENSRKLPSDCFNAEAYSDPYQTSQMKRFAKLVY